MSKQLREIQARKASLVKEARSITDIAAGEERDLNDEEINAFELLKGRIDLATRSRCGIKHCSPIPVRSRPTECSTRGGFLISTQH